MTATSDRIHDVLLGDPIPPIIRMVGVNGATYYHQTMVADVGGIATKVTAAPGLKIIGWVDDFALTVDTAIVGRDAVNIRCFGCAGFKISGTDPVTAADAWKTVYAEADDTIAKTSAGGTISPAGLLVRVVGTTAYVAFDLYADALLAAAAKGNDSESLKLTDFREVSSSGDVGAIAAIGGVLASDTTPILRADASESMEIFWAAGNSDIIGASLGLPPDFDGTGAVTVDLWVSSGTTDLASFTVETGWDGAALVSDAAVDTGASATVHKITATIAASDIPNAASFVSLYLTPGTHATDGISLRAVRVNYKRA